MKTRILLAVCLMFVAVAANAQTVQVAPNTTRVFTVNQTNAVPLAATPYTWTVNSTGGGVVSNTPSANTVSIVFGASGTAQIDVYATGLNGCNSTLSSLALTVTPLTYTATLSGTQTVCPIGVGQTGIPAAINVTVTAGATSIIYAIDGVAQPAVTVTGTTATINIATAFTALQAGNHTVEVVSVTGPLAVSLQASGSAVQTITVNPAPTIGNIF